MNRRKGVYGSVSLLGALLFVVGPARAQDEPAADEATAYARAAEPGVEHQRLAPLVGRWTVTGQFWAGPDAEPQPVTGRADRKWVLGNRFVLAEGTFSDGGLRSVELTGYDKLKQQYVTVSANTTATAFYTSTGTCDAAGRVFTSVAQGDDPATGETKKLRQVLRIVSDDQHIAESYEERPDGQSLKVLELTCTRVAPAGDEPAAGDLAKLQGKWMTVFESDRVQAIREIQGNREKLTRYANGQAFHAATVEFRLERRGNVGVFTFFNVAVTEGARKGLRNAAEQSYVYRVDGDTLTEAWGLLDGDAQVPNVIIWKRIEDQTTQPTPKDQPGFWRRLLGGFRSG